MRLLNALVPVLLVAAATAAAAQASALVEVAFTPQGRFVDAGETGRDIERTQAALAEHLQALGKRWLPPGARLQLDITEIDLAGRRLPTHPDRPRVLTGGADWPRIALGYAFTRADGVVERGTAALSDPTYLMGSRGGHGSEPLVYEKRMLGDWFRERFVQPPG